MAKTAAMKARLAATHDERMAAHEARVAALQEAARQARAAAAAEREAAARQAAEDRAHYAEVRHDLGIGRSLANSARRIKAVLEIPCPSCGTAAGAYCFSSCRSFHIARWSASNLSAGELGEVVTEEFGSLS